MTNNTYIPVYLSRHTPGLKPGDGAKIRWNKGETVRIISGGGEGRTFVITSDRMSHEQAPEGVFIREGYFTDDPSKTAWAKIEPSIWFYEGGDE